MGLVTRLVQYACVARMSSRTVVPCIVSFVTSRLSCRVSRRVPCAVSSATALRKEGHKKGSERERETDSVAVAILAQVGTHPRLEPNERHSGPRDPQLGVRPVEGMYHCPPQRDRKRG